MLNEPLFENWIEKEKRGSFNKKRFYAHFDPKFRIESKIDYFQRFFASPDLVKQHSFYPFIKNDLTTLRYKRTGDKNRKGKAIRTLTKKVRPIAYAAHIDAAIYSMYSTILTEKYEQKIDQYGISDNVLAYLEKEESNIQFANRVFKYIKQKGNSAALTFDVTSFFDKLNHDHLKKMWCTVLETDKLPDDHFKIYKSLTDYCYVERCDLESAFPDLQRKREKGIYIDRICHPKEFREIVRNGGLIKKNNFKNEIIGSKYFGVQCGIPQGSPLSACLSNIFMLDFDIQIANWIRNKGGIYYRYCDDIIVVIDQDCIDLATRHLSETIKNFELEINASKTEITVFRHDDKGKLRGYDLNGNNYTNLQYLGFEFNGQNIYIRSSSMSRYYRRATARIRENLKAAYGRKSIGTKVFNRRLLNRYTHKGKRNFITYAKRAQEHMNSPTIQRQYKRAVKNLTKKYQTKKEHIETKRNKKME